VRYFALSLLLITLSCSTSSPEKNKPAGSLAPTSHDPPKDLAAKMPSTGQVKMQLVRDHLLGKDFMPGGNLADYKTELGEYQMFLLEAPDAKAAAFMLLDWKTAVPEAKYLAHMGGYYGVVDGKPLYLFAKGPYLAGLVGLTENKADPEARKFAARL